MPPPGPPAHGGRLAGLPAAVDRSRATTRRILREGLLDAPGHLEFEGIRPSIRRHVCDLVEEYGRHTGHADLIREAIDRRVGEDPPPDWRPCQ